MTKRKKPTTSRSKRKRTAGEGVSRRAQNRPKKASPGEGLEGKRRSQKGVRNHVRSSHLDAVKSFHNTPAGGLGGAERGLLGDVFRGAEDGRRRFRLSVDPGIQMGWALWDRKKWGQMVAPTDAGILASNKETWEQRADDVMKQFGKLLWGKSFICSKVYIEKPFFSDTVGGTMIAKRDDFFKLCCIVGRFVECCFVKRIKVELVSVQKWKGQLSKSLVKERIQNRLGSKKCKLFKSHAWDAVGIGLYSKGHF